MARADIHPQNHEIQVSCSCGSRFTVKSTYAKGKELHLEICSACHPFYTGKQKMVDTAGRIDKFKKRYAKAKASNDK